MTKSRQATIESRLYLHVYITRFFIATIRNLPVKPFKDNSNLIVFYFVQLLHHYSKLKAFSEFLQA